METSYIIEIMYETITCLLIILNVLPFINNPHWIFRICEFGRIQLFVLQLVVLSLGWLITISNTYVFYTMQACLFGFLIFNAVKLIRYTPIYPKRKVPPKGGKKSISVISFNVYQFNNRYEDLINLINEYNPDILLTIETDHKWEEALKPLETEYINSVKVPLDNTYGMHVYTKMKILDSKVHYFQADDLPSIEVKVETKLGEQFVFFGVHPPPPSPTEEETSRERDGELLSVAKYVKKLNEPVLVVGDFNNVAWAKASILFRKISRMLDPRVGRGFVSTFHAKYKLLRFPIDLIFHSKEIFIEKLKTLKHIGSDHLPLYAQFFINTEITLKDDVSDLSDSPTSEDKKEADEMIQEGKKTEGDR